MVRGAIATTRACAAANLRESDFCFGHKGHASMNCNPSNARTLPVRIQSLFLAAAIVLFGIGAMVCATAASLAPQRASAQVLPQEQYWFAGVPWPRVEVPSCFYRPELFCLLMNRAW
jgi:hypothetical protein